MLLFFLMLDLPWWFLGWDSKGPLPFPSSFSCELGGPSLPFRPFSGCVALCRFVSPPPLPFPQFVSQVKLWGPAPSLPSWGPSFVKVVFCCVVCWVCVVFWFVVCCVVLFDAGVVDFGLCFLVSSLRFFSGSVRKQGRGRIATKIHHFANFVFFSILPDKRQHRALVAYCVWNFTR